MEDDDKMVQFTEILTAETNDIDDDRREQIILETGEWCPSDLAKAGDLKEVQGLFDKGVFVAKGKTRPEGRFISMRMIRRWTGEVIKSRLLAGRGLHKGYRRRAVCCDSFIDGFEN